MKISNETKRKSIICKLLNTLKDGKERTLEDIIRLLIDEHNRKWLISTIKLHVSKYAIFCDVKSDFDQYWRRFLKCNAGGLGQNSISVLG